MKVCREKKKLGSQWCWSTTMQGVWGWDWQCQ